MSTHDDHDLERIVRAGLAHHADNAPYDLGAPLPAQHSSRLRRGRLRPAAAAASAIAIPLGVWAFGHRSPPPTPPAGPAATASTASTTASAEPIDTSDWRVESYGSVQIRVPTTWGWGGAPTDPLGDGQLADCGATRAFVAPGDTAYESAPAGTAFVGRPVMMTDVCAGGGDPHPTVDAVWLGAAVKDGTQTYADGTVRETRTVNGVTVTVFSADTALRRAILGTAEPGDVDANNCPAAPPEISADQYLRAGTEGTLSRVSVCLYQRQPRGMTLLWSGSSSGTGVAAYDRAMTAALAAGPSKATKPDEFQQLYLGRDYGPGPADGPMLRWDRVDFDGHGIATVDADGNTLSVPLTEAVVGPWASGQAPLKAYAVGPRLADPAGIAGYFRGMLG